MLVDIYDIMLWHIMKLDNYKLLLGFLYVELGVIQET